MFGSKRQFFRATLVVLVACRCRWLRTLPYANKAPDLATSLPASLIKVRGLCRAAGHGRGVTAASAREAAGLGQEGFEELNANVAEGNVEAAERIFEEIAAAMPHLKWQKRRVLEILEEDIGREILEAEAKRGDIGSAEFWGSRMCEEGITPNLKGETKMIDAASKSGQLASAEHCWLALDVDSYAGVICACAKAGKPEQAELWLARAMQAGVEVDVISYNAVIDANAKTGKPERAEHWLARAIEAGVEVDVISYTAVIDACAKAGKLERAEHWLARAMEAGVEVDVISYTSVIDASAKAGNPERAEHWLARAMEAGVELNVISYTAVIDASAKAGNPERAEHWLAKAMEAGVEMDVISYNAVIHACAKAGKPERAEHWLARAMEAGVEMDVISYTAVINACAKAGNPERAEHWLARAREARVEVDVLIYTAAINACIRARSRQPHRAERLFRQMLSEGIQPDAFMFKQVSKAIGKARLKLLCSELHINSDGLRPMLR